MVIQSKEELINLALKTYKARNYIETIKICEKALANDVNNVRAYHGIALSLMMQRKYDLALEMYNKAISITPKDSKLYIQRGDVYLKIGPYWRAERDYREAKSLDAKNTTEVEMKIHTLQNLIKQKAAHDSYTSSSIMKGYYEQLERGPEGDYNYDMQEVVEDHYGYIQDWEQYTEE